MIAKCVKRLQQCRRINQNLSTMIAATLIFIFASIVSACVGKNALIQKDTGYVNNNYETLND